MFASCAARTQLNGDDGTTATGAGVEAAHDEHERRTRRWANDILKVASEYTTYAKVIDTAAWAPEDCAAPTRSTEIWMSGATEHSAHGRKLYILYTNDANAHARVLAQSPMGHVVVKEAHHPRRLSPGETAMGPNVAHDAFGKAFSLGDQAGLFVMMKYHPGTLGTDAGWVYGVTSPDHSTVLDVGMLTSCIECHQQVAGDRLFGHSTGR
jgi:hypothetical protein